jgi:hypothetical protein
MANPSSVQVLSGSDTRGDNPHLPRELPVKHNDDGVNQSRLPDHFKPEYKKNQARSVAQFFPDHDQGVRWLLTTKTRLRLSFGKVNCCRLKMPFTSARSAEATTARQACNVVACLNSLQMRKSPALGRALSTSGTVMDLTRQ